MTPEQRIKRQILTSFFEDRPEYAHASLLDPGNIDTIWNEVEGEDDDGELHEYIEEFRSSGEESGLPYRQSSRHYESDEVARVLDDGTAVGWTFWYGGGKYGEPEAIEWMDEAYEVEVKQETRVVNVYTKKA